MVQSRFAVKISFINRNLTAVCASKPVLPEWGLFKFKVQPLFKKNLNEQFKSHKCPLTEAKHSHALLNLIFWRNCMKIGCMILEMKISLMIFFSFFRQCYKIRVSAHRFSRAPLFHHFYSKIYANAHFNSLFSNIGWFNKKKRTHLDFLLKKK